MSAISNDIWARKPVKSIVTLRNGYAFESRYFDAFEGIPLIRIRDLNKDKAQTFYKGDRVAEAVITNEDILIGMDGDFNVGRWLGEGEALLNQRLCALRANHPVITRYLEYAIAEPLKNINNLTYATTVKHLSAKQVLNIRIDLPENQATINRIVDYLDEETHKINELVRKEKKLIQLLNEKRLAAVAEAVAHGLGAHVKLKKANIPWLDTIPAHWETRRAKYLFKKVQEIPSESDEVVTAFRDGEVVLRKHRREEGFTFADKEIGYQHVQVGDLVIHAMDAFAGAVGVSSSEGKMSPVCSICRPVSADINTGYYAHLIRSMTQANYLIAIAKGIRERSTDFRYSDFGSMLLPLPPLSEQMAILEFIKQEDSKIFSLKQKIYTQIELLEERKKSLISHAVTGKIRI